MKKLLFILLGIILFVSIIDASLDFFYFTGPGKQKAVELLSKRFQSDVEIERLKFRLLSGFTAYNIKLKEPKTKTDLEIKKIKLTPDYSALLSRKLVFKEIKLHFPSLNIAATKEEIFSFLQTLKPQKSTTKIKKIKIKLGSIQSNLFHLKNLSTNIKIRSSGKFEGSIAGSISSSYKQPTSFQSNIVWQSKTKDLFLKGSASSFALESLELHLKKKFADIKSIRGKGNIDFELKGKLHETIKLKTDVKVPSFQLALTPWQWEGQIQVHSESKYNFLTQEWDYEGEVQTKKGKFHTSFLPNPIEKIEGKFLFKNSFLTTNGVEGYFQNKSIRARGSIEKREQQIIHATLFTDLEPEKFLSIGKVIKPALFEKLSIKGKCFTQFDVHTNEETGKLDWKGTVYLKEAVGYLEEPSIIYNQLHGTISFTNEIIQLKDIEGELLIGEENELEAKVLVNGDWSLKDGKSLLEATLKNGIITSPWLKNPVTNLQAVAMITPKKIEIPAFSGKTYSDTFQGNSSIQIENRKKPEISFYISSPQYSLLFQGIKEKEHIQIDKLSGYGFGTTFDISGTAPLSADKLWRIKTQGKVDTIALKKAWPVLWEKAKWLQIWKPKGNIELKGEWQGIPKNKKSWQAKANFSGKRIEIKNLFFDTFQLEYQLKNKIAQYKNIYGTLGEGELTADLSFDFNKRPSDYSIELKAQNVDVINIPRFFEKETENFKLQGPFYGKLLLKGRSGQSKTAIGLAKISIKDGRLWDSPLLKPVWLTIKNFSQKLEKPVFKSAEADFKIGNNIMATDNLELKSPGLILKAEGNIGFDQSVDMLFKIQFLQSEGNKVKVLAAKGLNFFGKFLEIEYKGTLSDPIVKRRWLPILDKLVSKEKEESK